MNPDTISGLPDAVIHQILSCLPIRDAARTSLLSSKWRHRWTSIPYLSFDVSSVLYSKGGHIKNRPVSVVDHILTLHIGPVTAFKLCIFTRRIPDSALDRWILRVLRSSVEEIVLGFWNREEAYVVPGCLYSCRSLTSVELYKCSLAPLSLTFKGLKCLKSLNLRSVSVARDMLERLVSGCPVLESLRLIEVDLGNKSEGVSDLEISSASLCRFDGLLCFGVRFENTFRLAEVAISRKDRVSDDVKSEGRSDLVEFFRNLTHVRKLCIGGCFAEHFSAVIKPSMLPKPCLDLDYLAIEINFNDEKHSLTDLSILAVAPNLLTLKVLVVRPNGNIVGPPNDFWGGIRCNHVFAKLELLQIVDVSGAEPELDFIKFVLLNSPVLKRLVFTVERFAKEPELIEEQVLSLSHFSGRAEIVCWHWSRESVKALSSWFSCS